MVLLDEVFIKLDGAGMKAIIGLLRYMLKDIPSIIIISNQETVLREEFDRVATVVREGQSSSLILT